MRLELQDRRAVVGREAVTGGDAVGMGVGGCCSCCCAVHARHSSPDGAGGAAQHQLRVGGRRGRERERVAIAEHVLIPGVSEQLLLRAAAAPSAAALLVARRCPTGHVGCAAQTKPRG